MRIAGYAALFGVADGAGDTIRPGAFARTLAAPAEVPLLWQHNPRQRIGTVERIAEDARGLRVIARIDRAESRAASLLRARGVDGLSFGYRARGYPADRQDYMAGFVLLVEDADLFWRRIDSGLDEAAARGIAQRFVWALPQVCRDGYTRLPDREDDPMQAFDDVLYPLALGRDTAVSPEFSTSVAVTASGHERRSSQWSDARLRYDVGPGIRAEAELGVLIGFFRARRGAARGFRLADPFDFSSNGMSGTPTMLDQLIGVGDGLTASFRLVKRYGGGTDPQLRPITRPRAGTVLVSVDGAARNDFTLEAGGTIVFASAPVEGAVVRAGFLFDVPVRFAEDRLDVSGAAFAAGEAPSVPLVEVREAV